MEGRRLNRILAVTANTFRETVRERVLYNLVVFAFVMTASGLLLGQLSIRQDEKIIKDIGLAAIDLFGTVIALFIGVGLVSKEIERRSLYPLLAKPLTRDELYLGKFLGLAFTLLVNTAAMAAGLFLTLLATGRGADVPLLAAIYAIFLSLLLVVAIAMLFSTMTSIVLSAVSTLGVVIAGRFSDVIRNMKQVAPGAPEWLVKVLYGVLPNFRAFDFKDHAAYGDPIPLSALGEVTFYAAAYVGLLLVAGLVVFRRKDFQ
jgi:ABC-type transport system involved in multi-copper enzyme maturation permease subunit